MNHPSTPVPIFPSVLLLADKPCLVIGAGNVARRKIHKLRTAGADVTVVAPAIDPRLHSEPGITIHPRPFEPTDLDGAFLVIAATDNQQLNRQVIDLCRAAGILCSASDAHWRSGDLILPASLSVADMTFGISTAGQSCRRSRLWRENLSRHAASLSDYDLLTIGLDHERDNIARIELLKQARPEIETMLGALWGIHEFMLLDTCNRFEIIATGSRTAIPPLQLLLERIAGSGSNLRITRGEEAFARLALITAGLEAQAFGETRIVAQVKEALVTARQQNRAGSVLQGWLNLALRLSKEIRQTLEPRLRSLETEDLVAGYLTEQRRQEASILIIGRGRIGAGLAARFPQAHQISGRDGAELSAALAGAEVVLCATASPDYVVESGHCHQLRPGTLLIDLSLPRNIDPSLPGVVGMNELRAAIPDEMANAALAEATAIINASHHEYLKLIGRPHPPPALQN